jgi:hypothetical protein
MIVNGGRTPQERTLTGTGNPDAKPHTAHKHHVLEMGGYEVEHSTRVAAYCTELLDHIAIGG